MADTIDLQAPSLPRPSLMRRHAVEGNGALMTFVTLALMVSMSVTQEETLEPGSFRYWMLLLPAALLPMTGLLPMARTLVGHGWWLLVLVLSAGGWHLSMGDSRAAVQLGLLVWVLAWISSDAARLNVTHIVRLYLGMVLVGCIVYVTTDLNRWGPLPGLTVDEYGIWRVSFFPNIAYTAFLSLVVIMIITRVHGQLAKHRFVMAVAAYFLITSFVRTALIALVMYAALRWWFDRRPSPTRLFWCALLVGFGVNLAIAGSVVVLDVLQQYPLISRLFLRGESQLSTEEIFQQLYRPWLWWEHVQQFAASPALMGWGAFDFEDLKISALVEGQEQGDTVSLPTRLLAAYGIPGALFTVYLVARLRAAARAGDTWSCACFAPVLLLILQWGSVFHPSDALFALFMMTVVRGSPAFLDSAGPVHRRRTEHVAE